MTDLVLTCSVTRTALSLSPLDLNVAGQIRVVSYDPGGVTKERVLAKSPSMHGARQTSSKKGLRTVGLRLRFYASTKSALDARVQEAFDAFDQASYSLSVSVAGGTVTWSCMDAEWQLRPDSDAEGVDKYGLMVSPLRQVWQFTIPAQPVPTTGVF